MTPTDLIAWDVVVLDSAIIVVAAVAAAVIYHVWMVCRRIR